MGEAWASDRPLGWAWTSRASRTVPRESGLLQGTPGWWGLGPAFPRVTPAPNPLSRPETPRNREAGTGPHQARSWLPSPAQRPPFLLESHEEAG